MTAPDAPVVVYVQLMEEVKQRLASIRGPLPPAFASDFVALQLRKVLELIAFASLCANRDAYAAADSRLAERWKAQKILDTLRDINPEFYPKPVSIGPSHTPGVNFHLSPISSGFLTEDDFAVLYDATSDLLHRPNPFRRGPVAALQAPEEWVIKIQRLLRHHMMRVAGTNERWVIEMADAETGRVRAVIAQVVQGGAS